MAEIKNIRATGRFERDLKTVRDKSVLQKLKKQLQKIRENPEVGKPLRHLLKGERTLYVKPYRLIYAIDGEMLYLLRFEHRKNVYKHNE